MIVIYASVFRQVGTVSDRHGGLWWFPLLVAGIDPAGAYRAHDGAGLCQGVPKSQQERSQ